MPTGGAATGAPGVPQESQGAGVAQGGGGQQPLPLKLDRLNSEPQDPQELQPQVSTVAARASPRAKWRSDMGILLSLGAKQAMGGAAHRRCGKIHRPLARPNKAAGVDLGPLGLNFCLPGLALPLLREPLPACKPPYDNSNFRATSLGPQITRVGFLPGGFCRLRHVQRLHVPGCLYSQCGQYASHLYSSGIPQLPFLCHS